MRIRTSDEQLLGDLCDFLSRSGVVAIEAARDRATVLGDGGAPGRAALLAALEAWRERHPEAKVTVALTP